MEALIGELYKSLNLVCIGYLYYQSRKNIDEIQEQIDKIQEFSLWFLEENKFGLEPEFYQGMSTNLVQILQDIVSAMEQGDHVLLHDAIAYGFIDYLELFIPREDITNDHL